MIRHSNYFLFSIFIHIVIFTALFFSYKQLIPEDKKQKEETLLCINLTVMSDKIPKLTSTQVKMHKVKKVEVKHLQEPIKKIIVKKQVIIKQNVLVSEEIVKKSPPQKKLGVRPKMSAEISPKVVKVIKVKVAPEKEYIDEYIAKIIALLMENLYYPRQAIKRGTQGEVLIRFTLSSSAKISNVEVLSSTSTVLSRGAIQTINNIDNILPKPRQKITFNIPISYRIH